MDKNMCINRRLFILEFMTKTSRPVAELAAFLQAYDSCEVTNVAQLVKQLEPTTSGTLHCGTKLNVHPRAKLVKAKYGDCIEFYFSIGAAAKALGTTESIVSYACHNHRLINGIEVCFATREDLFEYQAQQKAKDNEDNGQE
jgi:hypothetical protein